MAVVGFVVGAATVAMTGKGFVEERGRRLVPVVVLLAVLGGLVVGWALNAWNDYIHIHRQHRRRRDVASAEGPES
jgi:1,4-dihydroxy-2-naphthoate octaprenyltransferase